MSIAHFTTDPGAYALIGHSGVNGDVASPTVVGAGEKGFPPFSIRRPYTPGEHIDVHKYCTVGHSWVYMTIWFTQP